MKKLTRMMSASESPVLPSSESAFATHNAIPGNGWSRHNGQYASGCARTGRTHRCLTLLLVLLACTLPVILSSCGSIRTNGVEVNALTISTTGLAFGDVTVNTPSIQSITLTSTGFAPITVSSVTISGTGFTMTGPTFPVTLSSGQSATVNVQFQPTTAGAATGQLIVSTASSNGDPVSIPLTGTGVTLATVSSLSCTSASFTGAGTDACTVTLNGPAVGDEIVNLSSTSTAVAVPAVITVPANSSSGGFTAVVSSVTAAQGVTLTASVGTSSATFSVQIGAVLPVLSVDQTSLAFGNVLLKTPATLPVTLTSTGSSPVTIYSATPSGPGFLVGGVTFPMVLNPNQAVTLNVLFDPTVLGAATGQLTIVSNSSVNPTDNISLSGTGVTPAGTLSALSCNPVSFTGGGSDACTVTLTGPAPNGGLIVNLSSSSTAVVVPTTVTVRANATTAAFTATVLPVTTAQSVTLNATAGTATASFVLQLNAATPTLGIGASSVAFGNVALNATATKNLVLTSTGTAPVTISSATATGPGFSVSGATLPVTLNPTQTLTLNVQFDPTVLGAAAGQLTIVSNSSVNSTANVSLTGTGVVSGTVGSLTCNTTSYTGAGKDACTVTLTGPAPSGGLAVNLSSSNSAVTVPATVTVAANGTTAGFVATVAAVTTAQTVTLNASVGTVSATFTLQLNAATPTIGLSTASIAFGNVAVNATATKTLVLTSTGTGPLTINSATATGPGFTVSGVTFPVTLNPTQTVTLSVNFDPASSGAVTGQVTVSSNSSTNGTAKVSLSGTGVSSGTLSKLSCSASSFTGPGTDACAVTLTGPAPNGGLTVNLSSSSTAVTVPATVTVPANATTAGFTATVASVTTGQTVTLTASVGTVTATFTLTLNAAVPTLSISTTSIAFGNVLLNIPATQSVLLTSIGTAPVTVNTATVTGAGFSLVGATIPVTLNPTQTATLNVQFDPTVAGAVTGQLTITSNSSVNGTANIALTGTGEAPAFEVQLTWDAPVDSPDPVVGYNVYRAPGGGTLYQLLNTGVVTPLTYADLEVLTGDVYDYYVVSVDANGVESVPSNTATVTVN
ncbi:MAG: choice-of-anchor D domain-containing protein [Terracidiphilus sp.]